MKKIDFPLIADVLFYSVSVWFLTLGILRYYRIGFALSVGIACMFALATGGFTAMLLYHRHRKKILTKKERERRDALLLHLALEKAERVRAALLAAFAADGKDAHCDSDTLSVENERMIPLFSMQPVSADEIAKLVREYECAPFTVACNTLSPEAEKLLAAFGYKAVLGDEIFSLFERTQTTPSPLICGNVPRKTAKQKWRASFSKKNARPFFMSALLLLTMSLFTIFPMYYLITGGVLLFCAVSVRIFGYAS